MGTKGLAPLSPIFEKLLVISTDVSGLADHVTEHCLHHICARSRSGKVQLDIQGVELKHIVVIRAGGCAGPEVSSATDVAGTLLAAVGKITHWKAFRNSLRGAGNVPDHPVQRVLAGSG